MKKSEALSARAEYLLKLKPRALRSAMKRMSEDEQKSLRTHWRLWAHAGQIAPTDNRRD